VDWKAYHPIAPQFFGTKVFTDYSTAELIPYIDWTPFFQTWELKGRYPAILQDEAQGEAARQLFDDAQAMLKRIVDENWFNPKAIIGFWSANTVGDDIRLYADEARVEVEAVFYGLRQQLSKRDGRPNMCLSDFVAPRETGVLDYVGGFVVTAGDAEDAISKKFERANDDYNAILVKALADRIAEAFAERMHERVRREFWGYAPDENFSNEELVQEAYGGIRPAPGYPAQPDHTEKATLFRILDAEKHIDVRLTESFAMWPGSSVSGLYIWHPESYYFGVAKVERDQVEDYAARKNMPILEVERWLSPILNYIPEAAQTAEGAQNVAPAGSERQGTATAADVTKNRTQAASNKTASMPPPLDAQATLQAAPDQTTQTQAVQLQAARTQAAQALAANDPHALCCGIQIKGNWKA
jgi:5-methyltetrahydrofolate--homocysteine methyltransferase